MAEGTEAPIDRKRGTEILRCRTKSTPLLTAAVGVFLLLPATAQQADYSGLDPFWRVAEMLASGEEPAASAWDAVFATPGYRTLKERDNADRLLKMLLPLALSPSRVAEREDMARSQPMMGLLIAHLRTAYEQREPLRAFQEELEGRALLDEALAATAAWLPAGSERVGQPEISFVIMQPDARGYDRIVMDLLLAYERQSIFEGLLAHEAHHVIRGGIQGSWDYGDLPEAAMLSALNNLQAEGMADMIDKRVLLEVEDWSASSTDVALEMMTDRFRSELNQANERLAAVDAILAGYAAEPALAAELGSRLRETLVMGGHPIGFHMATVVDAAGARQRMIDNVADPFDFVRAYNEAAAASLGKHHVLSAEAMRGLAALQRTVARR